LQALEAQLASTPGVPDRFGVARRIVEVDALLAGIDRMRPLPGRSHPIA
jgi:hypothetical protein